MAECTDKQIGLMLYAYELGMLSDEERQKVELHLLECDYCFETSKQFCNAARLLKEDTLVHGEIHRLAEDTPKISAGTTIPEKRKLTRLDSWYKLIPVSAVAVVIFIFLVLKDWQVDIRPSQEAEAFENRLAILPFTNATGDDRYNHLGAIFSNLLITDLSVSEYINVVSAQRINDFWQDRDAKKTSEISVDSIIKIGHEIKARWILTGKVLNVSPQYLVTTQLVDISEGRVVTTGRYQSERDTSIFVMVDTLTSRIKKDIMSPDMALTEGDWSVASLTTFSSEAYQYYLDGIRFYNQFDFKRAVSSFEKALLIDSSFAMVYYYLSQIKDPALINQALKRLNNVTFAERAYILSSSAAQSGDYLQALEELKAVLMKYPDDKYAYSMTGDYYSVLGENEKAIDAYTKVIELDSLYKTAYNNLAYRYSEIGEFEKALQMADKYLALAPGEVNPYDSRGDIYAGSGQFQQAIENYQQALAIDPDYIFSRLKLVKTLLIVRDYSRCDKNIEVLLNDSNVRWQAEGRLFSAIIPIRQGKFQKALHLLDSLQDIDYNDKLYEAAVNKSWLKAHIYAETNQYDLALKELDNCIMLHTMVNPQDKLSYYHYYAQFLIASGRPQQADNILVNMERNLDTSQYGKLGSLYIRGFLELSKNKPEEAIRYFNEAATVMPLYPIKFMQARLNLETGRYHEAVQAFEKLLLNFNDKRLGWSIWDAKANYYLAQAYEKTDSYDKAAEQYQVFINIYEEADTEIPEVADARVHLNLLNSKL